MKRVLVISYYWPPSGGAGVQRWLKFVKYLPGFDIQPVVLTVDPAQAEYPVLDRSLEADVAPELEVYRTGCNGVYDVYKKITGSKTAPYGGFANESHPGLLQKITRFVRGNFFLPDARRGWIKYAFPEACRIIEKHGINTIITTGPPHSTHLIGLKIKKKYRVKWIVDFRDPWTTIYYNDALYQTRWARKIDQRLEQKVLDACDHLLLVSVDQKKLSVDPQKVSFLPNGFDSIDFDVEKSGFAKRLTFCYTGTIAGSYPVSKLQEAFDFLRTHTAFKLLFVGNVAGSIKKEFCDRLGDSVEFIDFVSHTEAINYMMSSNILLLIIPKTENNQFIMPGKLFEYLATGKSIMLVGPPGSKAAQIIIQARAGAAFDYDDIEGMKKFMLQQNQSYLDKNPPDTDTDFIQGLSRKELTGKIAGMINGKDDVLSSYFSFPKKMVTLQPPNHS